jgi:hypothetical protein
MANINAPFGFRQVQGLGSAPTYEHVEVVVNYNAAAIYYGDPVVPLADGSVAVATQTLAVLASGLAGVFVGCKYLSVSQKRTVWSNYWPGSDVASGNTVTAQIINDPHAHFIAQSDATGLGLADVNALIGINMGTPNPANGFSGAFLDTTTLGTALDPFIVVRIHQQPAYSPGTFVPSDATTKPYDWAIVRFNNIATRGLTGI